MSIRTVLCAVACCFASRAFASEPGQPLDCSDWVLLEAGHTCELIPNVDPVFLSRGAGVVTDNAGRLLTLDSQPNKGAGPSWYSDAVGSIRIQALDRNGLVTVASIEDRIGTDGHDHMRPAHPYCLDDGWRETYYCAPGFALAFDAVNGRLLIPVEVFCGNIWDRSCSAYGSAIELIVIGGFASLYDVRQTFDLLRSTLAVRVPPMPEGMAGADHFDTYWGPLSHPIDFTQAQPLACDYPAAAPHVGDYLTVNDTLPTPAPGTGYYYVTSATYQGQTRYGRKTTAGHLSGRDPALLPVCAP